MLFWPVALCFFTLGETESKVSLMEFVFCFWFPFLAGSGAAGNLKSKFENLAKEQEEVRYFLDESLLMPTFLRRTIKVM